jgi:hypothetical protein
MQIKVCDVCAILAANRRKLFQLAHNRWQVSKAIFKFRRTRRAADFLPGSPTQLELCWDKLLRAFLSALASVLADYFFSIGVSKGIIFGSVPRLTGVVINGPNFFHNVKFVTGG